MGFKKHDPSIEICDFEDLTPLIQMEICFNPFLGRNKQISDAS